MSSITIHNFDEELRKTLTDYSAGQGLSLNKSVKKLLRKALGIGEAKKEDFSDLCGAIDKKEAQDLIKALSDFEKIDKEDWQ